MDFSLPFGPSDYISYYKLDDLGSDSLLVDPFTLVPVEECYFKSEDETNPEVENVVNSMFPSLPAPQSGSSSKISSKDETVVDDDNEEYLPPGEAPYRITRPQRIINKAQTRQAKSRKAAVKRRSCTKILNKHQSENTDEEDAENSPRKRRNQAERKRRADLSFHIQNLRKLIPDMYILNLNGKKMKPSELDVLNGAVNFIQRLHLMKRPLLESNCGVGVTISGDSLSPAEASCKDTRWQKFSKPVGEEMKRQKSHKEMEKDRRQCIKTALERLKAVIPVLKNKVRVSRRNILIQAAALIMANRMSYAE